ncbi:MAG: helix-turn-helix transcriptional regulator [Actinobacteria bacterium]|nr:MAG: helix-turn-helix transcriptional regulator [Actinomycetota bacterium]
MRTLHPARHLLRAKDLMDARYREPLDVPTLARMAHLSPAHFSREFHRVFGEAPHQYLLTRRLERAAALLRNTDWSVADICLAVGLRSIGSFTTSFGRAFGMTRPSASQHVWRRQAVLASLTSPSTTQNTEDKRCSSSSRTRRSGSTTKTRRSPSTRRSSEWSFART